MTNWGDDNQASWSIRHNAGGNLKGTCQIGLLLSEDDRVQDEPYWCVDSGLRGTFWALTPFKDLL